MYNGRRIIKVRGKKVLVTGELQQAEVRSRTRGANRGAPCEKKWTH
jgi:hypothetical protein